MTGVVEQKERKTFFLLNDSRTTFQVFLQHIFHLQTFVDGTFKTKKKIKNSEGYLNHEKKWKTVKQNILQLRNLI